MTPVELADEVRVSPKSIYRRAAEDSTMPQLRPGAGKGSTDATGARPPSLGRKCAMCPRELRGRQPGLFITVHPGAPGVGQAAPLPVEGMLSGGRAELSRRRQREGRAACLLAWAVRASVSLGIV
jgi:hypothetical protein